MFSRPFYELNVILFANIEQQIVFSMKFQSVDDVKIVSVIVSSNESIT
jgi:hypothetical protein